MLISIIIPTHNRAERVVTAIESVLVQNYTPLELIVVDDGSTDSTLARLDRFHDPRLRLVKQEHAGVSVARNTGVSHAHGHYLAFCDSDDRWLPQKLARQVQFTQEGGWAITQTDETWIRKGVMVNPKMKHLKKAGWIFEPSLELCLISPSCVLMTRECWECVGPFDASLPACEDYDLWLRLSLYYPVGFLPEQLVVKYGGHADQLSKKIIGLDLYRLYSMVRLIKRYHLTPEQRNLVLHHLEKRALVYIQGCLKRDKREEVLRIQHMVNTLREQIKTWT